MSEVHFRVEAQFPSAETSSLFFRAVYSRTGVDAGGSVEALRQRGVETDGFLDEEIDWDVEDCGVDDRERFRLKAVTDGESDVIAALTLAAKQAGATSVLTMLFDTQTGTYQALGADEEGVVELHTTENYEAVGDDWAAGMRSLLGRAHAELARLSKDGLLSR